MRRGRGVLSVPLVAICLGYSSPADRVGVASGAINAARQVGSVIGVALLGALVGRGTAFVSGLHTRDGHRGHGLPRRRGDHRAGRGATGLTAPRASTGRGNCDSLDIR